MKRLYGLGTIAFWLMWPMVHVRLRIGSRTRVLIMCEDEVLLVKGILSNGKWSLPGGGLKRGETPIRGAIREVREETGLILKPKQLTGRGVFSGINSEGHRYKYHLFTVRLAEKPKLIPQRYELRELTWRNHKQAATAADVGRIARDIVTAWYQ